VISDLHLGGAPGEDDGVGFQMCPPRNQSNLARFIRSLPARDRRADIHLIIAGDIVDFLAERPFSPFTADPAAARNKLGHIIEVTRPIWDALNEFVAQKGGELTLMLGNHDLELCLPGVRQLLLATIGEGRVEFLYDNQAWTLGPVLVEHGNRFDSWNAVPHGALRRFRSQLSRGAAPSAFPALPGSQLVVEIINPLKQQYSFVDLLKPETAALLPVLAAFGAGSLRRIWQSYRKYRQTFAVDFDEDHEPIAETYIGAADDPEQRLFDLSEEIALGGDAGQIGGIRGRLSGAAEASRRRGLFRALRANAEKHSHAFDVASELPDYEAPARRAAQAGYQVVVYGHTHLVKRVPLGDKAAGLPIYLNTGTWADLIRMPDAVWATSEDEAWESLEEFLAEIQSNSVARWRCAAPTFAKVELDNDVVANCDVYFFDETTVEPVSTNGLLRRLTRSA
jgi:UDP-2,3-diacylglucosamine pyrophosphatase LpxH